MSYLLHRAILRVRKGRRKYIPMALQIIVGVCLLSLSISLSFSLLKQMWEFSSYMNIPFAGVSTEVGDNSTKITESDLKKLKSLSLKNDFIYYKQFLSGEPFTIIFADKDFLTDIMGAESAVDTKLVAGQEVIDILQNWTPIDIQLRKFYDPEKRELFGYSLKEITPIKNLDYSAPGLLSAVTYTEGSLQVTSFDNVLLFPLEACGEFLCQSIFALPITSSNNAEITDDLNEIQSCLLSAHPGNSYKIINFGEEVRRTLSRNEQLASTVAILAGFILVIVFFGLTGLLLVFLNQRQREYAISLMCGATYHQLLTESYLEIALLVIMSTLLGTLSSIPFLPLFGGMGVSVHFSVWTLIVCIIGAMLVSLVVCVLSFQKIKRITPINVLKDL